MKNKFAVVCVTLALGGAWCFGDSLNVDADGDGPSDSDSLPEVFMQFDADGQPIVYATGGFLEGKTDLGDCDEPWGPVDLSVHRFFRARTGDPDDSIEDHPVVGNSPSVPTTPVTPSGDGSITFTIQNQCGYEVRLSGRVTLNISPSPSSWGSSFQVKVSPAHVIDSGYL